MRCLKIIICRHKHTVRLKSRQTGILRDIQVNSEYT
jgi:hypothetical protein